VPNSAPGAPRDFRARDLILAWHAGDVRTCPADPLPLNDGSALTRSRQMPSRQLATSPTAKDQDIETFRLLRHASSPSADLLRLSL
jgi:hypothetical protein